MTSNNYYYGSSKCAAIATISYLIFCDKETPSPTKALLSIICAVTAYVLSYSILSRVCVDSSKKYKESDTPAFKLAYRNAFSRLRSENQIEYEQGYEYDLFYKRCLDTICFGRTAVFLKKMDENPNISPAHLVKSLILEESVYSNLKNSISIIQKRYDDAFSSYFNEIPANTNWFPDNSWNDHSYTIPWKEDKCVIYAGIETEKSWIRCIADKFEGDLKGRLSFPVNSQFSHTFAFWSTGNQYGLFDNGKVDEFTNRGTFFKSLRDRIIERRRHYGQFNNQNELNRYRKKYRQDEGLSIEYWPVVIFTKRKVEQDKAIPCHLS